jgi:hypothetical protein
MTILWGLLKPLLPWIAGILLIFGAWLWFESVLQDHYDAGAQSVQQRWDADNERRRLLAEETSRIYASGVTRSQETFDARLKTASTRAATVSAELARVRASAASASSPAPDPEGPCAPLDQRLRRLEFLLREGTELAAEGSGRVGALDAKVTGLQVYAAGLQP